MGTQDLVESMKREEKRVKRGRGPRAEERRFVRPRNISDFSGAVDDETTTERDSLER